jgi:hypothetical protein
MRLTAVRIAAHLWLSEYANISSPCHLRRLLGLSFMTAAVARSGSEKNTADFMAAVKRINLTSYPKFLELRRKDDAGTVGLS